MGVLDNWRERWNYHRNIERNKILKEVEKNTGEKPTSKEKRKATEKANKTLFNRMSRRIAIFLGAIGITTAGVAMLTSGDGKEPTEPDKPTVETEEQGLEEEKTDREKFIDELKEGVGENTNEIEENLENVIDEILEQYNANLSDEEKIDKDDLGIILRENIGEGHIREITLEDGEKSYVENPLVTGNLPDGEEWIAADQIDDEYILVDTENNTTIAGIGTIDSTKYEIDIEYADFNGTEYVKNEGTYVGLPENTDLEEAYEDFADYYQSRTQQQEKSDDELER